MSFLRRLIGKMGGEGENRAPGGEQDHTHIMFSRTTFPDTYIYIERDTYVHTHEFSETHWILPEERKCLKRTSEAPQEQNRILAELKAKQSLLEHQARFLLVSWAQITTFFVWMCPYSSLLAILF